MERSLGNGIEAKVAILQIMIEINLLPGLSGVNLNDIVIPTPHTHQ